MRTRSLFDNSRKRGYSDNDKINWVFKYLILKLQPEICYSCKGNYSTGIKGKKKQVSYFVCDIDVDNIPEEIPFPFEGVFVTANRKRVTILGENFYYKFPPNFILTLYERFKNTLK